jgi:glycosyltransferase involved in cell wall biosynthesis
MNILIYTPFWMKGGIEKLIVHLTEFFYNTHRDDYNISILTESVPDAKNQFAIPDNASVYFRNYSPFNKKNESALREFVCRIDPDVIIVMGSSRAMYKIPRAIVGLPFPVILSEHNSDTQIAKSFYNDFRFLNAVRNMADVNHILLDEYGTRFDNPDNIVVIHNPIPASPFHATSSIGNTNKIIHVGRYDMMQKQQDILVKSFSKIAGKYPDWEVHCYGNDWRGGKEKLQALISSLSLDKQIFLHDVVNDVYPVLASGEIFAFPSAHEGFSLALGEALSCGMPAISFSDCPGMTSMIHNNINGILVNGGVKNITGFANAMDKLMSDVDLRKKMSKEALSIASAYSLDKFCGSWKTLIDDTAKLKGKNKLLSLSEMEVNYVNLISTGYFFDELAKLKRSLSNVLFMKKILSKYKLLKPTYFLFSKVRKILR